MALFAIPPWAANPSASTASSGGEAQGGSLEEVNKELSNPVSNVKATDIALTTLLVFLLIYIFSISLLGQTDTVNRVCIRFALYKIMTDVKIMTFCGDFDIREETCLSLFS